MQSEGSSFEEKYKPEDDPDIEHLRKWLNSLNDADLLEYCHMFINEIFFQIKTDFDKIFVSIVDKNRCDILCPSNCDNCNLISEKNKENFLSIICVTGSIE